MRFLSHVAVEISFVTTADRAAAQKNTGGPESRRQGI